MSANTSSLFVRPRSPIDCQVESAGTALGFVSESGSESSRDSLNRTISIRVCFHLPFMLSLLIDACSASVHFPRHRILTPFFLLRRRLQAIPLCLPDSLTVRNCPCSSNDPDVGTVTSASSLKHAPSHSIINSPHTRPLQLVTILHPFRHRRILPSGSIIPRCSSFPLIPCSITARGAARGHIGRGRR